MTEKHKGLTYFSDWVQSRLPHAVQAVKEFTGLSSEFSPPKISLKKIEEISEYYQEEPSICLLQSLNGGIQGYVLFAASSEFANGLVYSMSKQISVSSCIPESLLCQSLINEWANIFAGNLVACMPEKGIIALTPIEQTYDMSTAALDFIACQLGLEHQFIALGSTSISFENVPGNIQIWIIVSPSAIS